MSRTSRISRRSLAVGIAAVALLGCGSTFAQGSATTKIIAPFPAGGIVDALARIVGERLGPRIHDQVIVLNQPGANGLIAANALRNAPADGKTILIAPLGIPVLNPLVLASPGPAFGKDYVAVGMIARYPFAIAVSSKIPVKTLPELVSWTKSSPAHSVFGITGAGNLGHFLGFSLGKQWGINWVPVPYKGAPAMKLDMIAGRLGSAISGDAEFLQEQKQGTIRVIATTDKARSKTFPDVPTLRESGIDFDFAGWYGLFVPAGTPAATIRDLNMHVRDILAMPDVAREFIDLGFEVAGGPPEQLSEQIKSDIDKWAPIIKASGFSASN